MRLSTEIRGASQIRTVLTVGTSGRFSRFALGSKGKLFLAQWVAAKGAAKLPYTVQVRLDGENVRARVEEIWRWIDQRQVKPPMFQYRMTAADVALRLDFDNLSDASKFSEAFNGLVIGLTRAGANQL